MKIHELFLKPVDRPIDGVIKADDARNLQTELDEYVVTRDVAIGLSTFTEEDVSCCYAVQDKVWVHDPDGAPWEVYTVLADAPVGPHAVPSASGSDCCTTSADSSCCPS